MVASIAAAVGNEPAVSLVLSQPGDGSIDVGVHMTHRATPTCDTPAYRMAVYLLAAARHPPSWKTDLPPIGSVEVRQLSAGRLVRSVIR